MRLPDGSSPSNLAIDIDFEEGPPSRFTTLPAEYFDIRGLPPGKTVFELHSVTDLDGAALRRLGIGLALRTTSLVELGGVDGDAPGLGWLTGSVTLPDVRPPSLRLDELRLSIVQVLRADGSSVASSKPIRIPLDRMFPLIEGRQFAWDAGELASGGYLVELEFLGVAANVWVDPQQVADVDMVVPPLAETRLTFEDEATGAPLEVVVRTCIYTETYETHGTEVRTRPRCYFDENSKCVVFIGVPGSVMIQVAGPACGQFWHDIVVEPGLSERSVRVSRASWVDLQFVRDPEDSTSGCLWYGTIEISSGGEWTPPMWFRKYRVDDGTTSVLSFCVRDSLPLDVRFEPEEGSPAIVQIKVPAGVADPSDPSGIARRNVRVRVDV